MATGVDDDDDGSTGGSTATGVVDEADAGGNTATGVNDDDGTGGGGSTATGVVDGGGASTDDEAAVVARPACAQRLTLSAMGS